MGSPLRLHSDASHTTAGLVPPPAPHFTGRTDEIAHLTALLHDPSCHILTLSGPAGFGKTQLALACTAGLEHAVFLPLETLSLSGQFAPALARALRIRLAPEDTPLEQIILKLRRKRTLLLLDGLHSLPDAVPEIARIAAEAPQTRMLLTAREPLGLDGETVFAVAGLEIRDKKLAQIDESSAVQYFREIAQAQRARLGYQKLRREIAVLCRALEGHPLALRTAAALLSMTAPAELFPALHHTLDTLNATPSANEPVPAAVRAVFEHVWTALHEEEKRGLLSAASFKGPFDLRAARLLLGITEETLEALVTRGLIDPLPDGRMAVPGVLAEVLSRREPQLMAVMRQTHASGYARYLKAHEGAVKAGSKRTLTDLDNGFGQIAAAWVWMARYEYVRPMMSAMEALYSYCRARGRDHEGAVLFRYAQSMLAKTKNPTVRVALYKVNARFPSNGVRAALEVALQAADQAGDAAEAAFCHIALAEQFSADDPNMALEHYQSGLRLYEALGDTFYSTAAQSAMHALEQRIPAPPPSAVQRLEPREIEILRMIASGQGDDQIAARMIVSVNTVKKHVNSICHKLGVETRHQAVELVRRAGLR